MHAALRIPDINSLICDILRRERPQSDKPWSQLEQNRCKSTSALFALSLTGKWISETALNALWYRIYGLEPLVKCMGRDVWFQPVDDRGRPGPLSFISPLTPAHIKTLRRCAQRVREFAEALATDETRTETTLLRTISRALWGEGPLLPNLRTLEAKGLDLLEFIHLFVSSELRALTIHMAMWSHHSARPPMVVYQDQSHSNFETASLLMNMPSRLPHLTDLELYGCHRGYSAKVMSDAVCEFTNLTTLKCSYLTRSALQKLSRKASLRNLDFAMDEDTPLIQDSTAPTQRLWGNHAFPSLRKLKIRQTDIKFCMNFITSLEEDHTLIDFQCYPQAAPVSSPSWLDLTELLSERFPDTLQSLAIMYIGPSQVQVHPPQDTGYTPMPALSFTHLLAFKSLTLLRFDYPDGYDITDEDLGTVASTLTNLEDFSLFTTRPSSPEIPPRLTLASFAHFAHHCIKLRTIILEVDARAARIPPLSSGAASYRIRQMGVSSSLIDHPQKVAAYIFSIAPLADIMFTRTSPFMIHMTNRNPSEPWDEVRKLLLAYRRKWKR